MDNCRTVRNSWIFSTSPYCVNKQKWRVPNVVPRELKKRRMPAGSEVGLVVARKRTMTRRKVPGKKYVSNIVLEQSITFICNTVFKVQRLRWNFLDFVWIRNYQTRKDWSKLKAFADRIFKFCFGNKKNKRNIVGKGDNIFKFCFGNKKNKRKRCGKRRKCLLPAFSPFLAMFSKDLFIQGC